MADKAKQTKTEDQVYERKRKKNAKVINSSEENVPDKGPPAKKVKDITYHTSTHTFKVGGYASTNKRKEADASGEQSTRSEKAARSRAVLVVVVAGLLTSSSPVCSRRRRRPAHVVVAGLFSSFPPVCSRRRLIASRRICFSLPKALASNQRILNGIEGTDDICALNWCEYVITCLRDTRDEWEGNKRSPYSGPITFLITDNFLAYLKQVKHKKSYMFADVKPKRIDLSWQTEFFFTDCGIFTMRHTETYKGGATTNWKCGLVNESEEQTEQLMALRDTYLNVILRSHLNARREKVLQRAREWLKIKDDLEYNLDNEALS
ncbi:hypothetical protein QQ045_012866 [Rhodiola kirilowii]